MVLPCIVVGRPRLCFSRLHAELTADFGEDNAKRIAVRSELLRALPTLYLGIQKQNWEENGIKRGEGGNKEKRGY